MHCKNSLEKLIRISKKSLINRIYVYQKSSYSLKLNIFNKIIFPKSSK